MQSAPVLFPVVRYGDHRASNASRGSVHPLRWYFWAILRNPLNLAIFSVQIVDRITHPDILSLRKLDIIFKFSTRGGRRHLGTGWRRFSRKH